MGLVALCRKCDEIAKDDSIERLTADGKSGGRRECRYVLPVLRVVSPIHKANIGKVSHIDALEISDVDPVFARVGTTLVVGVDAAARAEKVLRRASTERVAGEHVFAAMDGQVR